MKEELSRMKRIYGHLLFVVVFLRGERDSYVCKSIKYNNEIFCSDVINNFCGNLRKKTDVIDKRFSINFVYKRTWSFRE